MTTKVTKEKKFLDLFSESFVTRFPEVKSYDILRDLNAIFVYVPEPAFCENASTSMSGIPPYLVKFKCFSEKSSRAVNSFLSKNPFFEYVPEISEKNLVNQTLSYSVVNTLNYPEFIDLVEAYCGLFSKQKGLSLKRFKMSMDFYVGKLKYIALEKNSTYSDLLKSYQGEADLYDQSFTQYTWDLMNEKKPITEITTDDSNDESPGG